MSQLEKNIANAFGDKGKKWLSSLDQTITSLQKHWSLTELEPVKNMSWNYVALAIQNNNPVVLKIGCDEQTIRSEYQALQHFAGHGAIKVIDIQNDYNSLLLEQAVPGHILKNHHPQKSQDTIHVYAEVIKKIASQPKSQHAFQHVSQWCEVIDTIQDERIPKHFIITAKELRAALLQNLQNEYLCHGDLHLENIIQHKTNWLSIDPKGIIGDIAFEAAAFDLISDAELKDPSTASSKIIERINQLSTALELDSTRLLAWVFLRIMISIQWFIEDNGDPTRMLTAAHAVYPLLIF